MYKLALQILYSDNVETYIIDGIVRQCTVPMHW